MNVGTIGWRFGQMDGWLVVVKTDYYDNYDGL